MDTCSRLEEPGGVGWKDVNDDRLQRTISGKRWILQLRAAAEWGRCPMNAGCVILGVAVGDGGVPGGSRRRRRGRPQRRRHRRRRRELDKWPGYPVGTSACAWSATF